MGGRFRWYQSRRLAVGRDPRHETLFPDPRTCSDLILFLHKHSPLVLALFEMADNGWVDGVCHAEPGLPKLLILSLERIGVMEPPEYAYREYTSKGTLRCDMMVFVGKSTRYPDVDPWFISTSSFRFPDTYRKAARKALRRLRVIYKHHLQPTPMGFFPPTEGRGRTWIARMRGLGGEEQDLEDTISHLSIYITGLDALYREQAAQLKQLIHRAEKATQELEEQRIRAARADYSLAALQAQI
jgi:hypothetical protein